MSHDVSTTQLNLKNVHPVVGKTMQQKLVELYQLTVGTSMPLYLLGPSGSGKTHIGKALLKLYSETQGRRQARDIPAYYLQLSQEDNKTTVVAGYRLVNGSTVAVDGLLARAAREGAIVFIDEITHSTSNMLLMLNAIDGQESLISIGDEIVDASNLKVIYGSNRASYAGNIMIPQSFANRVYPIIFEYPEIDEEVQIAKAVAQKEYLAGDITIPDSVFKYLVAMTRELRSDQHPLSVRNVSKAVMHMQLVVQTKKIPDLSAVHPDVYFSSSGNEAPRRKITKRITGKEVTDTQALTTGEVRAFISAVSAVGVKKFEEICLAAINYHVDIDGSELGIDEWRNRAAASII